MRETVGRKSSFNANILVNVNLNLNLDHEFNNVTNNNSIGTNIGNVAYSLKKIARARSIVRQGVLVLTAVTPSAGRISCSICWCYALVASYDLRMKTFRYLRTNGDQRQLWCFYRLAICLTPPSTFTDIPSFAVLALAVWNNIPAAVRDSVSLDTFKTAFKTYLSNCAFTHHATDSDPLAPPIYF